MLDIERARLACPLSAWTGTPGHCQWCDAPIAAPRRRTWCSNACARRWERNHVWRHARAFARRRAKYRCEHPGCSAPRHDCEVNHKTPRNGAGYGPGCHHHLDPAQDGLGGLEVLCAEHHARITAQQATARAAARRASHSAQTSSPAP